MSEKRTLEDGVVPGGKRSAVILTQQPVRAATEEKEFHETLVPPQVQELPGASTKSFETVDNGYRIKQRYLNDKNRLLAIFPEELWLLVFGKLDHGSQVERVSNASLFFREILSSQKHKFLFNRVWEIMESGYKNNADDGVALRLGEMLKLRLVCRSWCNAVENFYQYHGIHCEMNSDKINLLDRRLFRKLTLRLTRWTESFKHFLPHFRSTHQTIGKNPFVGRILHLRLEGDDNDEFKACVQNILETYGDHIWYCEIRFLGMCQPIPTVTTVYSRIREVLRWMPNLKVIDLTVAHYQEDLEQEDLESAITLNPLPALTQLQMIRCVGLPVPMFQELVSRNNHITALDFIQKTNLSNGCVPFMENLQALAVTFTSIEHLERQVPVSLPLTKLYLRLECGSNYFWNLDREKLFQVLAAKFKHTLTFLHLNLQEKFSTSSIDNAREYAVDLPHLKKLELRLIDLIYLDMLMPLAGTLTILDVSTKVSTSEHNAVQKKLEGWDISRVEIWPKLLGCAQNGRFEESNILSIFSKLERILFKYQENTQSFICSFSRQEWMEKMEGVKNVQEM